MGRVAIVTDSAADLPVELAAQRGIAVVPLIVTFGSESYRANVDITTEAFWARMTAPGAPFPSTAASSPGAFQQAFEEAFAAGAEAIVCVDIAGTLSATIKSAQIARDALPDREIHVVDTWSASMGTGLLALLAAELRDAGASASEIAANVSARIKDLRLYVALETLEYLKRGGRISGARAALGTILSVKPIITVENGQVEQADRVRTRTKARERLFELLGVAPVERLAVLHGMTPEIESFAAGLVARIPGGVPADRIVITPVGPSIGPHLGPGCFGAVILLRA
ncbi:MAG: hypothetical protein A2X23_09260 [Chloroflexi bacterium GWC2_73_18]|nr:MAG: hypothetical protein A2X23_09260 [Chloroflexi bacterium GWC2_73_18]